jgi:hypothetical protein
MGRTALLAGSDFSALTRQSRAARPQATAGDGCGVLLGPELEAMGEGLKPLTNM